MELFCTLAGHWPVPFASRRSNGKKLNHCWMCNETVVQSDGEWRLEHETHGEANGRASAISPPGPTLVAGGRGGNG